MKKTLISLAASCIFAFAIGIEFDTLSANFSQTVQSDDAKISYGGDFSATKENAVWHYKTPTIKNIFFSCMYVFF